jgi:hypothetical protein
VFHSLKAFFPQQNNTRNCFCHFRLFLFLYFLLLLFYRQPFPQHPHQGRSLVSAKSFADLSALLLLLELLLRLRELLGKVESPSSNPDSGNESSFDDRLFPDLLLACFSLLFRVFREW